MKSTILTLAALLGSLTLVSAVACGPNGSAEEDCCACVRDSTCAPTGFDFAECVNDGYRGAVDMGVDDSCVVTECQTECEGSSFQ